MNVNKININQQESSYYIASDIYDVSYHNNGATFNSLSALLSSENLSTLIPTEVRCGGMTIRFIQISDNKYVQYRLMSNEFTTDTTQWAIDDESVYIENLEFISVKTDADGRLLWWIEKDGSVNWSKGVPQAIQIKLQELEEKIKDNSYDGKPLADRVTANEAAIVAINEALDRKVDGVYVDNPKYIKVENDSDSRILNAITTDGTNYLPKADIDNLSLNGNEVDNDLVLTHKYVENPEFIKFCLDSQGRIIYSISKDGYFNIPQLSSNKTDELNNTCQDLSDRIDNIEIQDATNISIYYSQKDKEHIFNTLIKNCDFKAIYFSDIHGNATELNRIISLGETWKDNIDCIIDGGDDTSSFISTGSFDWFTEIISTSSLPTIKAVGNHDAWTSDYWIWATNEEIYNHSTKNVIDILRSKGVNVVQPEGADTNFYNYYYVDFGNIRIIILLSLGMNAEKYYDEAQNSWFRNVLSDANDNNKYVICVNHGPIGPNSSKELECNWTSFYSWSNQQHVPHVADIQHINDNALTEVDTFIENGGNFVCWLAGHAHLDFLLVSKNTKYTQFCFVTACSKGGTADGNQPRVVSNTGYDLFNIISLDTTHNLLKCWRIGYNTNNAFQEHNFFCWDIKENKLITNK